MAGSSRRRSQKPSSEPRSMNAHGNSWAKFYCIIDAVAGAADASHAEGLANDLGLPTLARFGPERDYASGTAPVSQQKRPRQSTTNTIKFERKTSKINEAD